jgi:hypothetical protein
MKEGKKKKERKKERKITASTVGKGQRGIPRRSNSRSLTALKK